MAESDFNFGPNFPPGGAPENARVNNAAFDAELKKAQQLQTDTIKGLTETIDKLSKQYDELNSSNKKLSEDELAASKLLRDKISSLTEILNNVKAEASVGGKPAPLSNVGIRERTETFDRLTAVIKDYQRSAAELKSSGKELDFDAWFEGFIEQQKLDQLSLQQQQYNYLLLNDVKSILKQSNTSLANLSEDDLEELAKRSIALSVEQRQREIQIIQQNKDIIKLNKDANAQEILNTKELIASRKFDPTKPIIEQGFKGINKDLDKIIENTKPRSLLKIVLDLMGPFGAVINFFIKLVVFPLMFSLGILAGFFLVQYAKFKAIGQILSGEVFSNMAKSLILVKNALVFTFRDLPLIISSFIQSWFSRTAQLFGGINKTAKFFDFIANKSESFFFTWTRLSSFLARIPTDLSRLYNVLGAYEKSVGSLSIFGKIYVIAGNLIVGLSNFVSSIGRFLVPVQSFGVGIGKAASGIASVVTTLLSPITNFFSTGFGKALSILDKFGFGIGNVFRFGATIGKYLGGILAPLSTVIRVLGDMPIFFKGLFSGNFYTMIKSILGLVVQVAGMILATVFGGPIGGLVAAMTLKLENILKWFDPIFDFLIYAGALVFGLLWSVYKDFVDPALEAISKVIMAVLNLSFSLLKPVFKFGQFVIMLLAPLFAVVALVFKGLGYVFKGIGMLADGLTKYVIDPFFKFMSDFAFKFIQPIYDFIADSFIGKMLGMETKRDRLRREAKEKEEAIQKARKEKEERTAPAEGGGFSFEMPSVGLGSVDTSGINEGIGKTKQIVTETVDKSVDVIKSTVNGLDLSISGLGDRIREFGVYIRNALVPLTASLVGLSRSLGVKALEMGNVALEKIDTPETRAMLSAATTPINYSTAETIKPSYTDTAFSKQQSDILAFTRAMRENLEERPGNKQPASVINNQQTTVVNNTGGGGTVITMPSNSERTVNQINNSVRPAG